MMVKTDQGQVNRTAAEIYDEFFVPALFQEWTGRVVDAAGVQAGQHVLDVACGTGVLAKTAAERVGETGTVIGLDVNDGMLDVARRTAPHIEWRQGRAEELPFDDNSFDAVISQFGLMFFIDKAAALREMFRVLSSGGHLAIAVWDSLENTPGYAAMTDLLQRLFGDEAANGLRAPFSLGDKAQLHALFAEAGISDITIETITGIARFPSIESWVFTDIKGWVLADMIDDDEYDRLLNTAKQELTRFETPDGRVSFDSPAHIITITKH